MSKLLFEIELLIQSNNDDIRRCVLLCKEIKNELPFTPEKFFAFEASLMEAVINAMEHGNEGIPEKMVRINIVANKKSIKTTVADEGDGFNYKDVPDPTSHDKILLETGRGLFFMKNLCDSFKVCEKGNIVKLKVNFK